MKYNSVNEIGLGESVLYEGKEYLVLINYIKGETDAKGFTPLSNMTILIDNYGKRTAVHDYRELDILVNIDEYWYCSP